MLLLLLLLRLLSAMGIMSPLAFGQMLQAPSTHSIRLFICAAGNVSARVADESLC